MGCLEPGAFLSRGCQIIPGTQRVRPSVPICGIQSLFTELSHQTFRPNGGSLEMKNCRRSVLA